MGQSALTVLAARPDLAIDTAVSDGSSLALGLQAADGPASAAHPRIARTRGFGGRAGQQALGGRAAIFGAGSAPLAEGGFLLTGISRLVTLDVSGTVTDAALPAGWIVQAPTGDPDLVMVGRLGNDNGPESRSPAATGLYLYRRSTGKVSAYLVAVVQVVGVAPALAGLGVSQSLRWALAPAGQGPAAGHGIRANEGGILDKC